MKSDEDYILYLAGSEQEKNQALLEIYRLNFPIVRSYVLKNSGDEDEAKDVFQEGMISLYKNIRTGKFKGESSLATYLFSICRYKWLRMLSGKKITVEADESLEADPDFEEPVSHETKRNLLGLMELIGAKCKEILLLSYYENLKMVEVAKRMGFKDEQNARNRKYKCMQKLRDMLAERPDLRNKLKF